MSIGGRITFTFTILLSIALIASGIYTIVTREALTYKGTPWLGRRLSYRPVLAGVVLIIIGILGLAWFIFLGVKFPEKWRW